MCISLRKNAPLQGHSVLNSRMNAWKHAAHREFTWLQTRRVPPSRARSPRSGGRCCPTTRGEPAPAACPSSADLQGTVSRLPGPDPGILEMCWRKPLTCWRKMHQWYRHSGIFRIVQMLGMAQPLSLVCRGYSADRHLSSSSSI